MGKTNRKVPRHSRMPHPEQCDLGTRIFKEKEPKEEDVDVEKCTICGEWEQIEFGEYDKEGRFYCTKHNRDIQKDLPVETD